MQGCGQYPKSEIESSEHVQNPISQSINEDQMKALVLVQIIDNDHYKRSFSFTHRIACYLKL